MKLLKSTKGIPIPKLFFVSDRNEIKKIPKGTPFIFGAASSEDYIVRILEYEVLYQAALRTGYPFDFKKILKENGFTGLQNLSQSRGSDIFVDFKTEGEIKDVKIDEMKTIKQSSGALAEFIKDSSYYVDIEIIKKMNIIPVWLDSVEEAVSTNIQNFAVHDNNMYNKKLDGMYGGIKLDSPKKNLIVIDISGSIPRAVSSTCLALAKNLSENFYADLLITGSKSTLYPYERISELDIDTIYDENGTDNDQVYFRKLLEEAERDYNTAIVFGDNHSPCHAWSNDFNKDTSRISVEDGKKLCKWKVQKVVSFHTYTTKSNGDQYTAGYADWFSPESIERIPNWVKDLK